MALPAAVAAQHQTAANGQNATPAPSQNAAAANSQSATPAPGQNATIIPGLNAPVPAGAIMLNAVPLGTITATGGGHYNPLPAITNGGGRARCWWCPTAAGCRLMWMANPGRL